jgi:ubiquinone/menaquinone biosynthesis C-methylase UbiE
LAQRDRFITTPPSFIAEGNTTVAKAKTKKKAKSPAKKKKSPPVSPERLTQMIWGFGPMLIMDAAIKHRVFDILAEGPKTLVELSSATGASHRGLRAILEALVGLRVLLRTKDRFKLAPDTSAFLVSSRPGYLGGLVGHFSNQLLDNWRKLPEVVRTGKPPTVVSEQGDGEEFFAKFVEDLFNLGFVAAQALADQLTKGLRKRDGMKILDIAAGSGVWSIPLAQRLPGSRIIAVDFPKVLPITRKVVGKFGLDARLDTIEGNIQSVDFGDGYSIATLGHILHSEGEAKSRNLLKKVYDALEPGGVIAISEFIPDDDRSGPAYPLLFAVNMLVHTDEGDTFTFKQMSGWLKEIGFTNIRKVNVPAPSPIVVATKR